MKKITYFFLCIVMVFALLGCQKSDSPKSEQIKHDLSASLQSYMNYPLGIESVSIDNSITDNNTFTADAIVIATTKYSQVEFQASFSYGNHSQDWTFNGCQWNLNNYQIKKHTREGASQECVCTASTEERKEFFFAHVEE